jgi:enoyl-CoA hydratase/carnithine racemase
MPVNVSVDRCVGVITLDRPPANSYDYDFLRELSGAIDDVRVREDVRALVLASASPRFFSAGADVKAFAAASPRRRSMTAQLGQETLRKLETTPLVVVAAISGHALGGGLEIALACDLRFAAKGAYKLGLTETALGLFPGTGGTQRLPRLVGLSRGIDLISRAATLGPEEAKELGIVDRLFEDAGACMEAAMDYAAEIAAGASEAIGRAKVAATQGYDAPLELGQALEREAITRVFVSDDAQEGIAAFTEKRRPAFRGS